METSEEFSVKQEDEEMDCFIDQVNPKEEQDPLSCDIKSETPETCELCTGPTKVPFSWEHVLERHGLGDVDYRKIVQALEAPKVFEHSVFQSTKAKDDNEYTIRDLIVNECKFKCKYCDHERSSWQQMSQHIYRTHKDIKKFRSLDPFDLVVDHKIFECPKCKRPILHDKQLIRRHFREAHKILLPKPIKVKVKRSKSQSQTDAKRRGMVTNECKFKCKYCPKVFESWQTTVIHHRNNHKSLGKLLKPSEAVIQSKFHACSLCGKELLKDNRLILYHMQIHNGKPENSKKHRVLKNPDLVVNECKFKCKYCPKILDTWGSTILHHRKNHKSLGKLALPSDAAIESKFHECKLCGKEVLKDNRLIFYHMKNVHNDKKKRNKRVNNQQKSDPKRRGLVINECKFKCKHCPKVFESWHTTIHHHRTNHKFLGKLPKAGDAVIECKFHACSLCGKELFKDNRIIKSHMKIVHSGKFEKSRINESAPKNPNLVVNECKFQCKYCPQVLDNWGATLVHHRTNHKSLGKLPRPIHVAIERKFHECSLCGKQVLKDNRLISYHMNNVHSGKHKKSENHKSAPINPNLVMNECKFRCQHCHKIIESWHTFIHHNRINHKALGKPPVPADVVIASKYHACNLCGKEVLKDNKLIFLHNKRVHMDKIKRNFNMSEERPIIVKSACTFQCKYCPQVFGSWKSSLAHHETNHKSLGDLSLPGDSLISAKYHICCLCGKEVLKDDHLVALHISVAHNLTAISYKKWLQLKANDKSGHSEKVFVSDPKTNGCTFRCKHCDHESTSWQQLKTHILKTHNSSGTKIRHDPFKLVLDHKVFECQECKTPILQDRSLIYSHMHHAHRMALQNIKREAKDEKDSAGSSDGKEEQKADPKLGWLVINECKFRCMYCPKVFNSWDTTLHHYKLTHKSDTDTPLPNDSIIESKFHTCCLCNTNVLKDNRIIYDHIRVAHNLTTTLYKRWLHLKVPDKTRTVEATKEGESFNKTCAQEDEEDTDHGQQHNEGMITEEIGKDKSRQVFAKKSSPPMEQEEFPTHEGTDNIGADADLFPLRRAAQKQGKTRPDLKDDAWFSKFRQLKRCHVVVRDVQKTARFDVAPDQSLSQDQHPATKKPRLNRGKPGPLSRTAKTISNEVQDCHKDSKTSNEDIGHGKVATKVKFGTTDGTKEPEDADASPDDIQTQTQTREENSDNHALDIKQRPRAVEEKEEIITKREDNTETDTKSANDSDAQFGNLVSNCLRDSNLPMVQKLALQGEILGLIASKIK